MSMSFTAKTVSLALALTALPGIVAPSPALAAAPAAPAAAAGPVTVARYTFDRGAGATGRVAENSGRGPTLMVRVADRGRVGFGGTPDRHAAFPAACSASAKVCPRALLEGADDPDLDPGTRLFRWGASVRLTKAQVTDSSNVVQKGVVATDSQWKMQIGPKKGKVHCAVVGQGSTRVYLARSAVTVADGKWHDVMCQRSGATLSVYVDGKASGRVTIPATVSIANARPLRIGGPNFNNRSDMYHGLLDDVYARLG
jgi:hypothetical protein